MTSTLADTADPALTERSRAPRYRIVPNFDFDESEDAAFLASQYGLTLDGWQVDALAVMLSANGDRRRWEWAARQVGISVPRQNGKNAIIEVREMFGLVEMGERILHTAHSVATARKAFLRLCNYFDGELFPEFAELVTHIRRANGSEAITLKNGGSIEFSARATQTGRGFSVDTIIFDEAQHLAEESHEALLPTISACPNPQTIYLGTPPGPLSKGDIFVRLRNSAMEKLNPRLAWLEWSIDAGDWDDDTFWSQVASVNPAHPERITRDAILGERSAFSSEGFERERLGVWHDYTTMVTVVDMRKWIAMADRDRGIEHERDIVMSVDMNPQRDRVSIALCGKAVRSDKPCVEVVPCPEGIRGTNWAVDWIAERARKWRATVVIDSASPAATYIMPLRGRKVEVITTGVKEMGTACGMYWDAVEQNGLHHLGQPGVDAALIGAKRRDLGDGAWAWHRRKSEVDISPLVAITLAHYGWRMARAEKTAKRKTIRGIS